MKALNPSSAVSIALTAACAAFPTSAATPGDFTCRNASAEITCDKQACEINTTGFTPKSVSREGGKLTVCAYSGCGDGRIDLVRVRGDLVIVHAILEGGPINGPAGVVFDRKQLTATLMWHGYAEPLNCGPGM